MQILLIEDGPRILAFLARGLEAEGFRVDGAGNGFDGSSRRSPRPTTPSSSTYCFQGSTGSRSCASCKEEKHDLPVVIVSAVPTCRRSYGASGFGASDYLAKPFSLDELVARIWVRVRGRPAERDDAIVVPAR